MLTSERMVEVTTDDELSNLALKWHTDKIKWYTGFYHELLRDRRYLVQKVLELGIGFPEVMWKSGEYRAGASIFMWADYFPYAEIYALDRNESILINHGRIRSFYFEQADAQSYPDEIGDGFDFIVDDASHNKHDQMTAIEMLVTELAPSGIYITEDVGYLNHDERRQFAQEISYPCELVEFKNPLYPNEIACCIVIRK